MQVYFQVFLVIIITNLHDLFVLELSGQRNWKTEKKKNIY